MDLATRAIIITCVLIQLAVTLGGPAFETAINMGGGLIPARIGGNLVLDHAIPAPATLVSSIFLHGSWAHALMNAGAALAFGTPVARYFGLGPRGVFVFTIFYLLCGGLASLGYGLSNMQGTALMVGASGAVSGLVGGATRLMGGGGEPGPFLHPTVISMSIGWIAVNLLLAVVGFAPGLGNAGVAWEAHIFGYVAGLLLVGLFGRVARPARA